MKIWHLLLIAACMSVIGAGASFMGGNHLTGGIIAAAALIQGFAAQHLRSKGR